MNSVKFARLNRDLCQIRFTKFHFIGVENVTSPNWFARVMFAEYYHLREHNSKDNLKEYINKDSLTMFHLTLFVVVRERKTLP